MSSMEVESGVWLFEDNSNLFNQKLEQGDLLRIGNSAPYKYGIVVTADCDLENKKHSGIVTFVPLISVADAICSSLIHDLMSRREDECRSRLIKIFELDMVSGLPIRTQLLVALRQRGFLAEHDFASVFESDVLAALLCCALYPNPTLEQCKLISAFFGWDWPKTVDTFSQQISSRGDFLPLCHPALAVDDVSVAWLRGVNQCQISVVALKTSEETEEGKAALRIGKLKSPFIYRLTQMFGQVFSDIGLPNLPKIALDSGA